METDENEVIRTTILNASLDCVITIDHEGNILEFNSAAEQKFGHRREDVIGKEMATLIIPPRLREKHRRGIAHFIATGEGPMLCRRVELSAINADGTEFPVELSIVPVKIGERLTFTGFLRDITQRKINEQNRLKYQKRLQMQYDVMSALTESQSLNEGAEKVLRIIGQGMKWDLGSFWTVDEEAEVLRPVCVWNVKEMVAPAFISATKSWIFSLGKGLPGHVWQLKQSKWSASIVDDSNFPRAEWARRADLKTGFGFPIMSGQKVLAVIEFFSREMRVADEELIVIVGTLGKQIGQFMERLSALAALHKAVEVRDQFLSIASHELKTPLTSLSLQLQLAQRTLKKDPMGVRWTSLSPAL